MTNRFCIRLALLGAVLLYSQFLFSQNPIKIDGPTVVCTGCYTYSATIDSSQDPPPTLVDEWTLNGWNGIFNTFFGQHITVCF